MCGMLYSRWERRCSFGGRDIPVPLVETQLSRVIAHCSTFASKVVLHPVLVWRLDQVPKNDFLCSYCVGKFKSKFLSFCIPTVHGVEISIVFYHHGTEFVIFVPTMNTSLKVFCLLRFRCLWASCLSLQAAVVPPFLDRMIWVFRLKRMGVCISSVFCCIPLKTRSFALWGSQASTLYLRNRMIQDDCSYHISGML